MLGVVGTSACVSGADVALPHPPAAHSIGYGMEQQSFQPVPSTVQLSGKAGDSTL